MAKDLIHESIKQALINDGWTVTDDPLQIELEDDGKSLFADLGAEKFIAAIKENKKIVVEVKSLQNPSVLNAFYVLLGQFLAYSYALEDSDAELFIGASKRGFNKIFGLKFLKGLAIRHSLKFVVVNLPELKIEQWINKENMLRL